VLSRAADLMNQGKKVALLAELAAARSPIPPVA
jgi:hypothetical protein